MALPSTPETVGILSRARIARLPSDAYLVNVGRGTAIDQEALADGAEQRPLAGAALDVMVPEPLPQDHPLWETKNLDFNTSCLREHDAGLHLRRQCGRLLCRSKKLSKRTAPWQDW